MLSPALMPAPRLFAHTCAMPLMKPHSSARVHVLEMECILHLCCCSSSDDAQLETRQARPHPHTAMFNRCQMASYFNTSLSSFVSSTCSRDALLVLQR